MRKLIRNTLTAIVLMTGSLGFSQAHANEVMIGLFIEAQGFSDSQKELAMEAVRSVKALAQEVKNPKAEVKSYLADVMLQDELDVQYIMSAYHDWRGGVEVKMEAALEAIAAFHGQLSPEQRQELMASLKKLKNND